MKKRFIINFLVFTITLILVRYLMDGSIERKILFSTLIGGIIFSGLMIIIQGDK